MKQLMILLDLNAGPRLDMPDGFANGNDLADAYTWDSNEDLLLSGFPSFMQWG